MLQKLADHIAACLDRASNSERLAEQATDSHRNAELLEMAGRWRHLARAYSFAESLERFLLDTQRAKDALPPEPPAQ